MATPNSGVEGVLSQLSSVSEINALLVGTQWAGRSLTYSFVGPESTFSTSPAYGYGPGTEPWAPQVSYFGGFAVSSAASALSKWSAVANVDFTLVADLHDSCGDLRFGFTDLGDAHAEAFSPAVGAGGDIWFSYTESTRSFAEGSYNYLALLHEIGHALGLKHPFSAFSAFSASTTVLPASLDSQSHTVMSYSAQAGSAGTDYTYRPTTPMVLDIEAIQYLYGANASYNANSTVYRFSQGANYHQTLWDAGGRDTISYEGSDPCVIDLRPGAGSMLGNPVYVLDPFGGQVGPVSNVWIAHGTEIESASSGGGADRLVGNRIANSLSAGAGNDVLVGGGGNDRLDGGGGQDIAVFSGPSADYLVTFNAATGRYAVSDHIRGRDGIDVVSETELFQFSDAARSASELVISEPVTGDAFAVIAVAEGFLGLAPGQPQFAQAMAMVASGTASRFALALGDFFAAADSALLSATVLSNFGVSPGTLGGGDPGASFTALQDALAGIFGLYSHARGQVVLNMAHLLAGLETDAVYGQAAAALQVMVAGDLKFMNLLSAGVPQQEPSAGVWG